MCRWHMNKDVLAYVRSVLHTEFGRNRVGNRWIDRPATEAFMQLYYKTLRSKTVADFDANLSAIKNMSEAAHYYLCRYWFNNHKEKLVDCWVNSYPNFGLTATSKAEGAHR